MIMSKPGQSHFTLKIIITTIIFVTVFLLSILLGSANITMSTIWQSVFHYDASNMDHSIIADIRIPRNIGALLVGIALALAGTGIQSVTRNSLGDPGLIGLNAGASLMIALTFAFSPTVSFSVLMLAGFIGAILGGTLVILIGRSRRDGFNAVRLILAGAAISALLTAVAQAVAIYFQLNQSILFWSSGGVSGTTWPQIYIALPVILTITVLMFLMSRQLTILNLGEDIARGLGQNVSVIRNVTLLFSMLLAGTAVSLVGQVAFVGLMVPHIARFLVGTDYRKVIPMTVLLGASFVMAADTIGRLAGETPISAVISFIGVPYFLFLVKRGGRII
ncbi:FecCD family ABC transporter permease [Corticicoccus populi]|uniref:FecCD family ABC transporter permease n=1 Tax=Corticicoccus populi TaxID=1812821 RepID=A0ABW5WX81_9STAP